MEGVRGEGFCETRLLKLKITDGEITHMTLVILIALLKWLNLYFTQRMTILLYRKF